MADQVFYCHKLKSGHRGDWYAHLFRSRLQVGMCGEEPIIRVSVAEDPEGDYYGWKYAGTGKISMIYPTRNLVEICFPYGTRAAEECGQGKLVRLKITELKDDEESKA